VPFRDALGQDFHVRWVGRPVRWIEEQTGARVAFVTRFGDAELVTAATVLQDGDVLQVLVRRDDVLRVEAVFAVEPEESE